MSISRINYRKIAQTIAAPMFLTVVLLAAPGTPQRGDFYHGRGSQLVDSHGKVVRVAGVSWWGLETENFAPLGLDRRPMDSILAEVHGMGFNTLRIPFSNAMLHGEVKPKNINYDQNPELKGLSPLEVMDRMIVGAREHGMRVILDRHRPDEKVQSDLWYTPEHSEEEWIADWKMLATRYRTNDTVIGFDLHNEPHGKATWGTGDQATDWRLAAERAGNAVLAINPHLLILVEGVSEVSKDIYWWGGNLSAAGKFPVRLSHPAQLVYSAHDYPPSVADQSWFRAPQYPRNLSAVWSQHWGYLAEENRVPVVLGEFGSHYSSAPDKEWMNLLVAYLAKNHVNALYWSLNPESSDTGGLLNADWRTVNQVKLAALEPILATNPASNPVRRTASVEMPAAAPATVAAVRTVADIAPALDAKALSQIAKAQLAAAQRELPVTTAAVRHKAKPAHELVLDLEPKHPFSDATLN